MRRSIKNWTETLARLGLRKKSGGKRKSERRPARFESLEPRQVLDASNLIQNGSFETPEVVSGLKWEFHTSIPHWSLTTGNNIEIQQEYNRVTPAGDQYVELDSDASSAITQHVTGLTVGGIYELRFLIASRPGTSLDENKIGVKVEGENTLYPPLVTPPEEAPPSVFSPSGGGFTERVIEFTAEDTAVDVTFRDAGVESNGYGSYLDNVRLQLKTIAVAGDFIVSEDGSTASVAVTLSHGYDLPITVDFALEGDTAVLGQDFIGNSGTLTFPPSSLETPTQYITVSIVNDTIYEGAIPETFKVRLSNPTAGVTITDDLAVGSITDNDSKPTLTVSSPSVVEGNVGGTSQLAFTVSLSNPTIEAVSFDFETANGTAVSASDYTATFGSRTFSALDVTPQTIYVSVTGDTTQEDTETLALNLTNIINGSPDSNGVGTILDDDAPVVSISAPLPIAEGDSGLTYAGFVISLDKSPNRAVTVRYDAIGITATPGYDFAVTGGTVTFAANTTTLSKTVNVLVVGDTIDEENQTFRMDLSLLTNTVPGTTSATATIVDDDAAPNIVLHDAAPLTEGNSGSASMAFKVTLSAASEKTISVSYDTQNGVDYGTAAAPRDFTAASGVVTFNPGQTEQYAYVTVLGDANYEPDELLQVNFSAPGLPAMEAYGVIENDDATPTVTFLPAEHAEGTSGGINFFDFSVLFTPSLQEPIQFAMGVGGGTATPGVDFIDTSGTTLLFNPGGPNPRTVSVLVEPDSVQEPDETLYLYLTDTLNSSFAVNGLGKILDDDSPVITVTGPEPVTEGDAGSNDVEFMITLDRTPTRNITVHYATHALTATEGADYAAVDASYTFLAGATNLSYTVNVSVHGDITDENDQAFELIVMDAEHDLNSPVSATAVIVDDDAAPHFEFGTAPSVIEGNSGQRLMTFSVSLSAISEKSVSLHWDTVNNSVGYGEAVTPRDFVQGSGTLTFAPGSDSPETFSVQIKGDEAYEPNETLRVDFSSPSNGTLLASQATGTIVNDDAAPEITIADATGKEGDVQPNERRLKFLVALGQEVETPIQVSYATALNVAAGKGFAQADDFEGASGYVELGGNHANYAYISVAPTGDKVTEDNEVFYVDLSLGSEDRGATVVRSRAAGTIENDDDDNRGCCELCCGVSVSLPKGEPTLTGKDQQANPAQNPHPIVTVTWALPESEPVPDLLKAELNFSGIVAPAVYYDTTGLQPGQELTMRLQVDATTLSTGYYGYDITVTSYRGEEESVVTSHGETEVFNRIDSPYGAKRWINNLDELAVNSAGASLVRNNLATETYRPDGAGGFITPSGSYSTLTQDGLGNFTLTFANQSEEVFNAAGQLVSRSDQAGNTTTFVYTAAGAIESETDPFGRQTLYAYDENGHLHTVTDFAGRVTYYDIDAEGLLQTITPPDPDGAGPQEPTVTSFLYDANGRPIQQTIGSQVTNFEYNFAGRISKITYPDSSTWQLEATQTRGLVNLALSGYDAEHPASSGHLLVAKEAVTVDQLNQTATVKHDPHNNVSEYVDETGVKTIYERNGDGRLTRLVRVNPDNASQPLVTSYSYDSLGNVLQVVYPDNTSETWTYDPVWQKPLTYVDQLNRTTIYALDSAHGLVLSVTQVMSDGPDLVTSTTYTDGSSDLPIGLPLTMTDPNGNVTTYSYFGNPADPRFGWLQSVTSATGTADEGTVEFEYDAFGNVITQWDELDRRTDFVYDALDRLVSMTQPDPDGAGPQARPVWTYAYNEHDQVVRSTDPLGQVTIYTYDAMQRVIAQAVYGATGAPPADATGAWKLDEGTGSTVVDSSVNGLSGELHNGVTRVAGHDGGGLDFNGSSGYVSLGNPSELDITGEITIAAWVKADSTNGVRNIVARGYSLGPNGEVFLRIASGVVQIGSWNGGNHAASATFPTAKIGQWIHLAGTYDGTAWKLYFDGELVATQADSTGAVPVAGGWAIGSRGTGTERFFDGTLDDVQIFARGLGSSEIRGLAGGPLAEYAFDYDALGRLTSATDSLGRVTHYAYDALGRTTGETQPDPDGTGPLSAPIWQYQYDAIGRLKRAVDPLGLPTTYVHDKLGRVTQATTGAAVAPPTADSVGYWNLNETTGAAATDQSGNGHNGVLHGTTTVDGRDGAARRFDGVDDYIALGNPSELQILNEITISAWIKPEATNGLRNIVAKGYTTSPNGEIFFRINSGNYQFGTWNGTNYFTSAAIPAEDLNQWVHLTGVYDGASWRIYRNGSLLASTASPQGALAVAGNWAIGARGTGSERFFQGAIDEVRIYDRGLSPLEVATLPAPTEPDVVVTTHYTYDDAGQLVAQTDPLGRVTAFEYDDAGRLVKMTQPDPDGAGPLTAPVWETQYDTNGNVIAEIDPLQNVTAYAYDHRDRLITITYADPDGPFGLLTSPTVHYEYDAASQLLTKTDPLGRETTYGYDALGRLVELTQPDPDDAGPLTAPVWSFTYDLVGNRLTETDPRSNTTSYVYDGLYQLATVTQPDPDGVGPLTAPVWRTVYDSEGNLRVAIDPVGTETRYTYDGLNRRTGVSYRDAGGAEPANSPRTGWTYDAIGNAVTTADRAGNTTTYAYDNLHRLKSVKDAAAGLTSFRYDLVGNTLLQIDAEGRRAAFSYDALDRLTQQMQVDASGAELANSPSTTLSYDAVGNVLSQKDRLNHTTNFAYDGLYRLRSETNAEGGITAYAYDAAGNLLSLTDPELNKTRWVYDSLDRTIEETNELEKTRYFSYDAVGNRVRKVDRNGRATEYAFDNLNRNTTETWLDGSNAAIRTLSFAYDRLGRLTSAADPAAEYGYAYDFLGRLTSQSQDIAGLPQLWFTSDYNSRSLRTSLSSSIGGVNDFKNEYTYDPLSRLTSLVQHDNGGNSVANKQVGFAYNATSQLTSVTRKEAGQSILDTAYTYDPVGRLASIAHGTLAGYDYTYDRANRITVIDSLLDGVSDFAYDDTDQLTGADHANQTDESYTYDENGNRTMPGHSVGGNNRPTSNGVFNYEYDDEGNQTAKVEIVTGNRTEYGWDHRNRLVSVTEKNSSGTVLKTVEQTYDVFNQWIKRSVDNDGPGAASAVDTYFAYEDGQIVLELQDNDGLGPNTPTLTHRYLWDDGIDQLLADEQVSSTSSLGNVIWSLTDHLGTVRDAVDRNASGQVEHVLHRVYNAFGSLASETNPSNSGVVAVDLLFGFTGRPFDDTTGLQNNLHRWYDATLGQWISEDPIGFQGGDKNLRRYVSNQPSNGTDWWGLDVYFVTRQFGGSTPEELESYRKKYNGNTKLAHGYLMFTDDEGNVTHTFSWHPNEWAKGHPTAPLTDVKKQVENATDANNARPGRVWENDPADMDPANCKYAFDKHLVTKDKQKQAAVLAYIRAWVEANKVGYEKGAHVDDPNQDGDNTIGREMHKNASKDAAKYFVYGQNCFWFSTTTLDRTGVLNKKAEEAAGKYNLGVGTKRHVADNKSLADEARAKLNDAMAEMKRDFDRMMGRDPGPIPELRQQDLNRMQGNPPPMFGREQSQDKIPSKSLQDKYRSGADQGFGD